MVVLAGILGALNISKESIKDQKILSFGAGTAGMGIANQILDELMQAGLTEEEAKQHFLRCLISKVYYLTTRKV
ncbi:hypothetical protein BL295_07400 [Lactiplantibacillus plantarum]|nr:hypothetical protein BL295_07400 [Lactiplantibacillus plantarum]